MVEREALRITQRGLPHAKIIRDDTGALRSQLIEHDEQYHAIVQQTRLRDLAFRGPSWTACYNCLISRSSSKMAAKLWKLGVQAVVKSSPGGYTFLTTPVLSLVMVPQLRKVPFDPLKDRVAVTHLVEGTLLSRCNLPCPSTRSRSLRPTRGKIRES